MNELDNILLFEQNPEAMELVKSGEAIIGPGGIRRKGTSGKGFLDLAKPAMISAADFMSLFEDREHAVAVEEHLSGLEFRMNDSDKMVGAIGEVAWLNNAAIERTYTLTYDGFRQTLAGISSVVEHLSNVESYIKNRDNKKTLEKVQSYINYLNSDAGKLRSTKLDVTNSNIDRDLDQVAALLKVLVDIVEKDEENTYEAIQIIINLITPFANVVRVFSSLYYYENDKELKPGDYEEWVNVLKAISSSKKFKEKLEYYINLETTMPFTNKVRAGKLLRAHPSRLLRAIEYDMSYIETHTKEQYLSLSEQVLNKIAQNDFFIEGKNMIIFLDAKENNDLT